MCYDYVVSKYSVPFTFNEAIRWIPIIGLILGIAIPLYVRIASIEQKVDNIAEGQKVMTEIYRGVETRYGALALKVRALEVVNELKE